MFFLNALNIMKSYRGFIFASVIREFESKYNRSLLGVAWTLIHPLSMILIYTVIFTQVMKSRLPDASGQFSYGIYLCSGLLVWGFFSEICGRLLGVFLENSNLIKKIKFPRVCLPIISIISSSINFFIIFGFFIIFLILTGNFPWLHFLAFIPLTLIVCCLALGLGLLLGILNVFFRDVGQFFGIFINFWFWLTPIVYPLSILPDKVQKILWLNPMLPVIKGYQDVFVYSSWPNWISLLYPLVLGFLLLFIAFNLYSKKSIDLIDEL